MNLKQLQEEFVRLVVNDTDQKTISFRAEGRLTDNEALDVYRNDYESRMLEALGSNYEATWLLLGDEDFFKLGKNYILQHPSSFKSLINYGHSFPEFLDSEGLSEDILSMANFERSFWRLFHQSNGVKIEISENDLQNSFFNLENIYLIRSSLKIEEVWINRESNFHALEEMDLEQETFLALFKTSERVQFKLLSGRSFQFLSELQEKGKITLCETLPLPEEWKEIFEILYWAIKK